MQVSKKKYVRKTVTWEGRRYEVRAETEREAVEKLFVLKDQLRRGEKIDGENRTVTSWFREWMDVCKIPGWISAPPLRCMSGCTANTSNKTPPMPINL